MINELPHSEQVEMVKSQPSILRYIKNQTLEICLSAISKDPESILYVRNPSLDIYSFALKKDYTVLKYMPKTRELCLHAIEINPQALFSIAYKDQTPEICLKAIKKNPKVISACLITKSSGYENIVKELETKEAIRIKKEMDLFLKNLK